MPSTHSATITYYATYIPLACLFLPVHTSLPVHQLTPIIPPLIVIPWASLIAVSRVWLGHHTWPQVIVGCTYGFSFAWAWLSLWMLGGVKEWGAFVEGWVEGVVAGIRG